MKNLITSLFLIGHIACFSKKSEEVKDVTFPKINSIETISFFINKDNEIIYENKTLKIFQICDEIKGQLIAGKGINLRNSKHTSYKFYLEVYNSIKSCYVELWNEKANDLFGTTYSELNEEQLATINERIKFYIQENKPE